MTYEEIDKLYGNSINNYIDHWLLYEYDERSICDIQEYDTIIARNSQCLKLRAEYEDNVGSKYSYAYLYKDSEYIFFIYDDREPDIKIYKETIYYFCR